MLGLDRKYVKTAKPKLSRTNIYLDPAQNKILAKIGASKGGLKVAQVIRMAIQQFIEREKKGVQ
jgi:hypothetical protein